jgi:hypothetical protein
MSSPSLPTPTSAAKELLKAKGVNVSECMLGNSVCTIVGVCGGMYLGIKRKNLRPFVYAITAGSAGDLFYGYYGNCREMIEDYRLAKTAASLEDVPKP